MMILKRSVVHALILSLTLGQFAASSVWAVDFEKKDARFPTERKSKGKSGEDFRDNATGLTATIGSYHLKDGTEVKWRQVVIDGTKVNVWNVPNGKVNSEGKAMATQFSDNAALYNSAISKQNVPRVRQLTDAAVARQSPSQYPSQRSQQVEAPQPYRNQAPDPVPTPESSGLSGAQWVALGVGAVALGAGAYYMLRPSKSSPTAHSNGAPEPRSNPGRRTPRGTANPATNEIPKSVRLDDLNVPGGQGKVGAVAGTINPDHVPSNFPRHTRVVNGRTEVYISVYNRDNGVTDLLLLDYLTHRTAFYDGWWGMSYYNPLNPLGAWGFHSPYIYSGNALVFDVAYPGYFGGTYMVGGNPYYDGIPRIYADHDTYYQNGYVNVDTGVGGGYVGDGSTHNGNVVVGNRGGNSNVRVNQNEVVGNYRNSLSDGANVVANNQPVYEGGRNNPNSGQANVEANNTGVRNSGNGGGGYENSTPANSGGYNAPANNSGVSNGALVIGALGLGAGAVSQGTANAAVTDNRTKTTGIKVGFGVKRPVTSSASAR